MLSFSEYVVVAVALAVLGVFPQIRWRIGVGERRGAGREGDRIQRQKNEPEFSRNVSASTSQEKRVPKILPTDGYFRVRSGSIAECSAG